MDLSAFRSGYSKSKVILVFYVKNADRLVIGLLKAFFGWSYRIMKNV